VYVCVCVCVCMCVCVYVCVCCVCVCVCMCVCSNQVLTGKTQDEAMSVLLGEYAPIRKAFVNNAQVSE